LASKKQLTKASRRLRHSLREPEDIIAIEAYRDSLIPEMFSVLDNISSCLSGELGYLITGRPKRTKSIIRKLQRAKEGTSVSRMIDIVGLRIVVEDRNAQEATCNLISSNAQIIQSQDYLERESGYRAIHLYVQRSDIPVEVQIRTLPQQLWANECERLGERAKEGVWSADEREYLDWPTIACRCLDNYQPPQTELKDNAINDSRNPIEALLPRYESAFTSRNALLKKMKLYFAIYDSLTKDLLNCYEYPIRELQLALKDYHSKGKFLPEERFDLLLLNSSSQLALQITHPTYFPLH
jgi:ppGpp synthetase/RelA/SpoT-type nucleotidyltranferase